MKLLSKIIDRKTTIPALLHIAAHNGRAIATDCEAFLSLPTVAANGLYEPLSFEVGIFNKQEQHSLDHFPQPSLFDTAASVELIAEHFLDALRFVAHAQSNEKTRYYLQGVFFDYASGQVAATDGHRLALRKLPQLAELATAAATNHNGKAGQIVPKKVIDILAGLPKQNGNIQISVEKADKDKLQKIQFFFPATKFCITTKTIDGTYPQYDRVIPSEESTTNTITINSAAFLKAYKTAKSIADLRIISFSADGFAYSSQGTKLSLPDIASGLAAGYGFSAEYLKAAIKATGEKTLQLKHSEGHAPAAYRNENSIYVLMPRRV